MNERGFPYKCAKCGKILDGQTCATLDQRKPKDGDVSLCMYCNTLAIFDVRKGRLRKPTQTEIAEILKDPEIARVRAAIAISKAMKK